MKNTISHAPAGEPRALLSALWIAVLINILSADIFTFVLKEETFAASPWIMLALAVVHEIPVAMIVLSRMLRRNVCRTLNCVAAGITAFYVIAGGSLTPHYIFFALMELICLALIVFQAKRWPEPVRN